MEVVKQRRKQNKKWRKRENIHATTQGRKQQLGRPRKYTQNQEKISRTLSSKHKGNPWEVSPCEIKMGMWGSLRGKQLLMTHWKVPSWLHEDPSIKPQTTGMVRPIEKEQTARKIEIREISTTELKSNSWKMPPWIRGNRRGITIRNKILRILPWMVPPWDHQTKDAKIVRLISSYVLWKKSWLILPWWRECMKKKMEHAPPCNLHLPFELIVSWDTSFYV